LKFLVWEVARCKRSEGVLVRREKKLLETNKGVKGTKTSVAGKKRLKERGDSKDNGETEKGVLLKRKGRIRSAV